MRRFFAFSILAWVKCVTWFFFKQEFTWSPVREQIQFRRVRVMVFLNHTSLYEPLFLSALSFRFLWTMAGHFTVPGADVTLDRPFVGSLFKLMIPKLRSITRKRDASWDNYLDSIEPSDVVGIAAEGRMKRPDGLDKNGHVMTVRGGVADIIERIDDGVLLICLSGGLHHVQAPGELFPSLFQPIRMHVVQVDIREYKSRFQGSARERKILMTQDLQKRLETDCPEAISRG